MKLISQLANINPIIRFTGRATLQNWSLILYGSKKFFSASDTAEPDKLSKIKSVSKKKNIKKQKNNKNIAKTITSAPPTPLPKLLKNSSKYKFKSNNTASKDLLVLSSNVQYAKKKKIFNSSVTMSPYFYAFNNTKFQNLGENGKQYSKFGKNFSITYPIMVPARDGTKARDPFKKAQKQKEKSRDLNSNRNIKVFTPRPSEATTLLEALTSNIKDKSTGNITIW